MMDGEVTLSRKKRYANSICSPSSADCLNGMLSIAERFMPTHQFQVEQILVGEQQGGEEETDWVSWRDMCKPKQVGGLGFQDVDIFNLHS